MAAEASGGVLGAERSFCWAVGHGQLLARSGLGAALERGELRLWLKEQYFGNRRRLPDKRTAPISYLAFFAAHRFFCASEILFRAVADILRLRPRVGAVLVPVGRPRRLAGPNDPSIAAPSPANDRIAALS